MSQSDDIDPPHDEEKTLVAEYVLGLLDFDEHERVRVAIESDPRLQREERLWQWHFESLDAAGFGAVEPPAALARATEARLFGRPEEQGGWLGIWNSLTLWRGLAAGAAALAVIAIGVALFMPPRTSDELAMQLVAALEAEGSDVRFVALYDAATGMVRVTGLSGLAGPEEDFELWVMEGDGTPTSMGVIEAMTRSQIPMNEDAAARWAPGMLLAITREPEGGSPTGGPTGPVVAQGTATLI